MGKNGKHLDLERVSLTLPAGDVPWPGTTWTQPQTSQMCAIIPPHNPVRYSPPLASLWIIPGPCETKFRILLSQPHCLSYLKKMYCQSLKRRMRASHSTVIVFRALGQGYSPSDQATSNQNPCCTRGSLQCRPNRSIPHYARLPSPVRQKLNAVCTRAVHRRCIPSQPGRTRDDRESGNYSQWRQPDQASIP